MERSQTSLKAPRGKRVEKVQQPTAGDNAVGNYLHPYWAEDLGVVCSSVVSGPAARFQTASVLSSFGEARGGGASVGAGEEGGRGDKSITGNPTHLTLHAAESCASVDVRCFACVGDVYGV